MKSVYKFIFFIGLFFAGTSLFCQINYPSKIRLNTGWEFLKGDLGSIWEGVRPVKPDAPELSPIWEKVSLPHCFNAEDAVDPYTNYYEGSGWYRTYLDIKNPYKNGRTILEFEGAGQKTTVYVYTTEAGRHVGGYDEWTCDITDAVKAFLASPDAERFNGKIPLLIRCDNSRDTEMIPSDLSDFNVYGGIYRYLNLVYLPDISLNKMQINAQADDKGKKGTVEVQLGLLNPENTNAWKISIKIMSPAGKTLTEETFNAAAGLPDFRFILDKPSLWSPDSPVLYTCEAQLESGKDTTVWKDYFGFRSCTFAEKGPFFLNGKRLLLRGAHRHEDHAGVGAAMTEEMMIREMKMIKAMGANFIRLGHYQQSRIILEQCDKLGILVWEEIPWCRGGLGGESYQNQAKNMLRNMITQHRNHPSVILWGLGNENDWPNDFPEFDKEKIRSFMTELRDLAHQLDHSRLTSIRRCEFCKDIPDVYSPSIWAGWYSGKYTDYKETTKNNFDLVKRFLHVEWGGDSHARRHAEYPNQHSTRSPAIDGDWSETYICDLYDWHLKEQENMPWLTGAAFWTFKDFSTPIRPENPVPYVNQKGVVERDFTPKESYYLVQSYWTDEPMIHIYGHTWHTRWGDENEEKEIKVYSNCPEVELFFNGQSLGIKKRNSQDFPAAGLRWKTIFKQGNNTVKAIGKKGKQTVSDEISFSYQTEKWGKEAQIQLSVIENTPEYAWIEAKLLDEKDVLCLDSNKFIYFDSTGEGNLIVNQGTSTGSKKVQAYNGTARIKLNKNGGKTIVSAKTEEIKPAFIIVLGASG